MFPTVGRQSELTLSSIVMLLTESYIKLAPGPVNYTNRIFTGQLAPSSGHHMQKKKKNSMAAEQLSNPSISYEKRSYKHK